MTLDRAGRVLDQETGGALRFPLSLVFVSAD
jgi:hypothetical protein